MTVVDVRAYSPRILDHAERRLRTAIAGLPDGTYRGEESTDGDCFDNRSIVIRVEVRIDGEAMTVDLTGTDPQMRGFKNSSLANTYSAVYMALLSFFDPDLPRNEGAFRTVHIVAPEGSVVNARAPAPMTMCTVFVAHEIIHAVWKALGQAAPERSCAGWGKPIHGVTSVTGRDREPFVMYHWNTLPGAGATAERDGFNQIGHLIALGGITLPDVETSEQLYPVRFRKLEFRRDTAGAGRLRGGSGVDYEVDIEVAADYSFRGEGLARDSGYGTQGGHAGRKGTMTLYPEGQEPVAAPRYGLRSFGPLRMVAASPAGGGWGSPLERDPEKVLRDVLDGIVSIDAATEIYGVVLATDGQTIDQPATAARRTRQNSE